MFTESPGVSYTLDWILGEVSWYWHTQSYSSSLWAYRAVWEPILRGAGLERLPNPLLIQDKPLGYSWFPFEVIATARSWVEHWFPGNLVFYRAHESVSLPLPTVFTPPTEVPSHHDKVKLIRECM